LKKAARLRVLWQDDRIRTGRSGTSSGSPDGCGFKFVILHKFYNEKARHCIKNL